MKPSPDSYFTSADAAVVKRSRPALPGGARSLRRPAAHADAGDRPAQSRRSALPDLSWSYCGPFDWVVGFHSGQLWLALQLTGDPVFLNAARARRPVFRADPAAPPCPGSRSRLPVLAELRVRLADDRLARGASAGARGRHRIARPLSRGRPLHPGLEPQGSARRDAPGIRRRPRHRRYDAEPGAAVVGASRNRRGPIFATPRPAHAATTAEHLVRDDGTSFHTFVFDAASGRPLRGETHQGLADDSCWSRGHAWMIHGFAQCALSTGEPLYLDTARRLAARAEALMGDDTVPVWDFAVPDPRTAPRDSSAGAIMAAGLHILARLTEGEEAASLVRASATACSTACWTAATSPSTPPRMVSWRMAPRMSGPAIRTPCCPMATISSWKR